MSNINQKQSNYRSPRKFFSNLEVSTLPRDRNNPFTMISNQFVSDNNLSEKARLLGITIMMFPSDWFLDIKHLAKHFNRAEKTISSWVNELVEKGYLKINEIRKKGKFFYQYFFSEAGEFSEEKSFHRTPKTTAGGSENNSEFSKGENLDHIKETTYNLKEKLKGNGNHKPSPAFFQHTNTIDTNTNIKNKQTNKGTGKPVQDVVDFSKKFNERSLTSKGSDFSPEQEKIIQSLISVKINGKSIGFSRNQAENLVRDFPEIHGVPLAEVVKNQILWLEHQPGVKPGKEAGALLNCIKENRPKPEGLKLAVDNEKLKADTEKFLPVLRIWGINIDSISGDTAKKLITSKVANLIKDIKAGYGKELEINRLTSGINLMRDLGELEEFMSLSENTWASLFDILGE